MSDEFPVAMAYVPWQRLDKMYPPETALARGTLFPELDKPFMGRTVTRGGSCNECGK
ncbi:MAG: spore coat associated protein CotJA [Clostridiales bacterium]|nr:spore coat associated protein CotJA [Clostridiales bacterium]